MLKTLNYFGMTLPLKKVVYRAWSDQRSCMQCSDGSLLAVIRIWPYLLLVSAQRLRNKEAGLSRPKSFGQQNRTSRACRIPHSARFYPRMVLRVWTSRYIHTSCMIVFRATPIQAHPEDY